VTDASQAGPQWHLYLVRCAKGQLYAGVSTDVSRRFAEHRAGGPRAAKFLRGKGPLELVYVEAVGNQGDALRREMEVKKWSRQRKLALIAGGVTTGRQA
jgi:putative endonuclease